MTDPAAACDIRVSPTLIEGEFHWREDEIFRPLAGVFSESRLVLIAPVTRKAARDGKWRCHFAAATPSNLAGSRNLEIVLLETGGTLYFRGRRVSPHGDSVSVETLLRGTSHPRICADNGFATFLLLPLPDQIAILYRDLLARAPDTDEEQCYRNKVVTGEMSILDVRDEIATGEEAQGRYDRISRDDGLGKWCLWGQYDHVLPFIAPAAGPASALGDAFNHIATPSTLAGLLARIAVGRTNDISLYQRWIEEHPTAIARIASRIRTNTLPETMPELRQYSLNNLLPSMETGSAGMRRSDGTIRSKRAPGFVAYGPYVTLPPGRHAVVYDILARQPSGAESQAAVEVVYGDVLLARRELATSGDVMPVRLDFAIPEKHRALLDQPKFEFRLWSDGEAIVEIMALSLEVCADAGVPQRAPNVENWLRFLEPGPAGARSAGGVIAAKPQGGHVFFGPYIYLLPGEYFFRLECAAGEAPQNVLLEIIGPDDAAVAEREFRLEPGRETLELDFRIETATHVKDLFGPLEFRLDKSDGGAFRCLNARVLLANEKR